MPARQTDWVDTLVGFNLATGTQDNTRIDGGSTQVVLRGVTIIRTILNLSVISLSIAGAYGVQAMNFGIGISSREAFNAGVFPDPEIATDKPSRGWLWRHHLLASQNGTGTPIVSVVHADIRGARKIEDGIVYLIVANTPVIGTTFTASVQGIVRQLVKLP